MIVFTLKYLSKAFKAWIFFERELQESDRMIHWDLKVAFHQFEIFLKGRNQNVISFRWIAYENLQRSHNSSSTHTCLTFQRVRTIGDFLDEFAKYGEFDPLDITKWFKSPINAVTFSRNDIIKAWGKCMFKFFKGSLLSFLKRVYPEVKFDEYLTISFEEGRCHSVCWEFFLTNFAKSKQFDPWDPKMWHRVSRMELIKWGGKSVLKLYKGSLIAALKAAYPDSFIWKRRTSSIRKWDGNPLKIKGNSSKIRIKPENLML